MCDRRRNHGHVHRHDTHACSSSVRLWEEEEDSPHINNNNNTYYNTYNNNNNNNKSRRGRLRMRLMRLSEEVATWPPA